MGNKIKNKAKLNKIDSLMDIVNSISYKFSKTVYLSSMDIEKEFLK